eukprot:gb/GECG01010784.1/.p1 GENE.gb/GECG01010784.1/~~gb/GECG01010784.1/.p1  ORF type:complete len:340 (+),score=54.25 gb/GECG01010784.1/:1-1020(+)
MQQQQHGGGDPVPATEGEEGSINAIQDTHVRNRAETLLSQLDKLQQRAHTSGVGSHEDRKKTNEAINTTRRALGEIYSSEARKAIVQQRPTDATSLAKESITHTLALHGKESVESIPAYLLLAEAQMEEGKYAQAQELLSIANWTCIRLGDEISEKILANLHRKFGKSYLKLGHVADAAEEVAKDIYYSSIHLGPEHIDTTPGYFLMAKVFFKQHRPTEALALYNKILDIWYKYLINARSRDEKKDALPDATVSECLSMLDEVKNSRRKHLGEENIATGEAFYVLGLMLAFVEEFTPAIEHLNTAKEIFAEQYGEGASSTLDIDGALKEVKEKALKASS